MNCIKLLPIALLTAGFPAVASDREAPFTSAGKFWLHCKGLETSATSATSATSEQPATRSYAIELMREDMSMSLAHLESDATGSYFSLISQTWAYTDEAFMYAATIGKGGQPFRKAYVEISRTTGEVTHAETPIDNPDPATTFKGTCRQSGEEQ